MKNTAAEQRFQTVAAGERDAALKGLSETVRGACALLEAKRIQVATGEQLAPTSTQHSHRGYEDAAFGHAPEWQVALAEALERALPLLESMDLDAWRQDMFAPGDVACPACGDPMGAEWAARYTVCGSCREARD